MNQLTAPKNQAVDLFALYERSVQSPKWHIDWFVEVYRELGGSYPSRLREDFCGTFRLSCEWVKRNYRNSAIGLDLDPGALAYGRKHHFSKLTKGQQRRLSVLKKNVLTFKGKQVDMIIACNFSFYIFKQRKILVNYFRSCLRSLNKKGVLLLEMSGGPGMIETTRERKVVKSKGKAIFTYIWDQKSFDPITHDARYSIHFKMAGGRMIRDAFTYDWRLWTLPEVKDALAEAGFGSVHVYWETEHNGEGTGEYLRTHNGDNAFAWIAYVAASPLHFNDQ